MQHSWPRILRWCTHWPAVVRIALVASFVFVLLGPAFYGYDVPLDLGDPQIPGPDKVSLYDEYTIHVPAVPAGLAFGVLMSMLGCVAATLVSDVWFEDKRRPAARLVANFASTIAVLIIDQVQSRQKSPSFTLMKFSSSFCGALSAFTGTIGDVFDECFGVAYEESSFDDPEDIRRGKRPASISGMQNFIAHWGLTMAIMLFGVYASSDQDTPPILQPRVMRTKIDAWGTWTGRVSRPGFGYAVADPPMEY